MLKPVMLSTRGQNFWPRPQTFGLGLASISLSYYVIGHFSGKSRIKFGNFVNFSGSNLNRVLIIINLPLPSSPLTCCQVY